MTVSERFWSKVDKGGPGGCWLWTGGAVGNGYGGFGVGSLTDGTRRVAYAHRYAYELLVGPVPEGLVLGHRCHVRRCINPVHLEPVTGRVNALRGKGSAAAHARKTHCPKGHPYDLLNTYVDPAGRRHCRECSRTKVNAWKRKQRASRPSRARGTETHCPAGHLYDEVNTYRSPRGDRQCRICRRAARMRYNQGRFIQAIEDAADVPHGSHDFGITAADFRVLKPHRALVVDRVRAQAGGLPAEQAAEVARRVAAEIRVEIPRRARVPSPPSGPPRRAVVGGLVSDLTEPEARAHTDEIKRARRRTPALLAAYERRAWAALGYPTWEAYVRAELDMSRNRAWQLLRQGRVVREIEAAAGGVSMELSEAEALALKPHLDRIRSEAAKAPPEQAAEVVAEVDQEVVTEAARETLRLRRERRQHRERQEILLLEAVVAEGGADAVLARAELRRLRQGVRRVIR